MRFKVHGITLSINWFFIIVIVVYSYSGFFVQASYFFVMILLHEIFHVISLWCFKVNIKSIEIMPFGGRIVYDTIALEPYKEIIVLLSGPLCNILLAILLNLLNINGYYVNVNFFLFIINIMPILPLDGGKISRVIISRYMGYIMATRILYYMACFFSVINLIYCFLAIEEYNYSINISIISASILSLFVIWTAYKENKMAIYIFMKEIVYKKTLQNKRGAMRAAQIVALDSVTIKRLFKMFLPNRYHMIVVLRDDMKTYKLLTETQILDAAIKYGINCPLKYIITKGSENTDEERY